MCYVIDLAIYSTNFSEFLAFRIFPHLKNLTRPPWHDAVSQAVENEYMQDVVSPCPGWWRVVCNDARSWAICLGL